MKDFLVGRAKSLKYALRGMFILLRTEHAIISQVFVGVIFMIFGFYFGITKFEWIAQLLLIGLVLAIEGLNTAVEGVCDFIHPEHHEKIGYIKDVAAGAVSFAVFTAMIGVVIIYAPYVIELF